MADPMLVMAALYTFLVLILMVVILVKEMRSR